MGQDYREVWTWSELLPDGLLQPTRADWRIGQRGEPDSCQRWQKFRTGVEANGLVKFAEKLSWNVNATWSMNRNVNYVFTDLSGQTVTKNTTIILSPSWIGGSQLSWNAFPNFN